jgi:hypothetical protein
MDLGLSGLQPETVAYLAAWLARELWPLACGPQGWGDIVSPS